MSVCPNCNRWTDRVVGPRSDRQRIGHVEPRLTRLRVMTLRYLLVFGTAFGLCRCSTSKLRVERHL
jgi:hypothetical protein